MNAPAIQPGTPVRISPTVLRLTAPNPGVMTGPGTNTYIVGNGDLTVIDPGPVIESHIDAILAAVGARLKRILCTHTHQDHSPAAIVLKQRTGAELVGLPPPKDGRQDLTFAPDRLPKDGERFGTGDHAFRAVHTPGHASNQVCWLLESEKLLFTGDHVMQGSTVVIRPPDGNMKQYLAALEKLLPMDIARFAPGHGHPIEAPHDEVRKLIRHRLGREAKVVAGFAKVNPGTLDDLVPVVYDDVSPSLHPVAKGSLLAHLDKLREDGRVVVDGERWRLA